eukprot:GHVR01071867.1.p1 GENE.GHVR01071867.1~~GHVR01071867.1.p1  ORF type:complete len:120 (+),score=12.80 GHVR01071867.1:248-607(+)
MAMDGERIRQFIAEIGEEHNATKLAQGIFQLISESKAELASQWKLAFDQQTEKIDMLTNRFLYEGIGKGAGKGKIPMLDIKSLKDPHSSSPAETGQSGTNSQATSSTRSGQKRQLLRLC